MVAAFAKKIARLALSAPPPGVMHHMTVTGPARFGHVTGVMVGVVFVMNLLKRHPNCRVLLHRSNSEGEFAALCGFFETSTSPL